MITLRQSETLTSFWNTIFHTGCSLVAIICAVIGWCLLCFWIFQEKVGGLGIRNPIIGVTANYFNWHIISMGTACLLCLTPSILAFEVFPWSRYNNKKIHMMLNTMAMICIGIGFIVIWDCHNILSKVGSFQTIHGICGLIVICLFTFNWTMAFLLYVVGWGGNLKGNLKALHKRLGLSAFLLALANMCIGLMEKDAKSVSLP